MKRGCDVASHPRIDNTKAETAERYGTQMSRSEDYLDQLLKGMAPAQPAVTEPEKDISEENLFSDILEEFADDSTDKEALEEMLEDDDIFGDDIFDDDFLDADFLEEFERELAELEMAEDADGFEEAEPDTVEEPNVTDEMIMSDEPEEIVKSEEINEPQEVYVPELSEEVIEEHVSEETGSEADVLSLFDGLDSILNGVQEESEDLFADDAGDSAPAEQQEDPDVLKILEGLEGIDLELDEEDSTSADGQDFSALEGFLAASASDPVPQASDSAMDFDLDSFAFDEGGSDESAPQEEKAKKTKKEKKTGFMNKLGLILFGEDDEDDEEEDFVLFKKKGAAKGKGKATPKPAPAATEQGDVVIGVASDDDLALFGEYSGTSASASSEPPVDPKAAKKAEKEKKKKEKKEAKEKAKKEKQEKKAKAPKKEKKPKKPKEPDNTPPLPKKPVLLIFVMVASFVALVILGADLLGYSNQLTNAKNQYAKKNYSEAFAAISGMEIKEEDMALYNKYHVMAMVSAELEAYESLMSQEFYDMALDCLVRTVGRADKYRADAESYGCIQELNELELKAETILSETFNVSKEEALEFYSYRNKKDYSIALAKVLKELGLEKVTE